MRREAGNHLCSACPNHCEFQTHTGSAMPYAYAGKKVCIHNFASAANPGGGVVKGSSAQEEAICRCSTLYPNLKEESLWKQFYAPHRRQQNPLHNDDCIYTPGVIAFKSDTAYPKLLL